MKATFATFLLVLFWASAFAQDWAPVHKGDAYHYDLVRNGKTVDSKTIWIDSVRTVQGVERTYLGRDLRSCMECFSEKINELFYRGFPIARMLYYRQAGFLQDYQYQMGNLYKLEGTSSYTVVSYPKVGQNWIFEDKKSIHAVVSTVKYEDVMGEYDSVAVLVLSTLDTVIYSKEHGILKFPAFDGKNGNYILRGVQDKSGRQELKTKAIYNYEVGDIFEHHTSMKGVFYSNEFYNVDKVEIKQIEILSKFQDEFGYNYGVKLNIYSKIVSPFTEENVTSIVTTIRLPKYIPDFDLYQGQSYGEVRLEPGADRDFDSRINRSVKITSTKPNQWFEEWSPQSDTLIFFYDENPPWPCEVAKTVLGEGVGIVYSYHSFMDMMETHLVAFRKKDQSYGTLTDFSKFVKKEEPHIPTGPVMVSAIYPMPAKDNIVINYTVTEPATVQMVLVDINGRKVDEVVMGQHPPQDYRVAYEGSNLKSGVYYLQVNVGGQVQMHKVVVAH